MNALTATKFISEEEYRDAEETANCKHEWFQGEIYPMPGGTKNHTIIVGNIYFVARNALNLSIFEVHNSEQRVKIEATGLETYPDAVIYELPGRYIGKGESTLLTPKVIFEVLSQSTEKYDRRGKFEQYKQIESLTDYVLIDQNEICVEHFARTDAGWNHRSFIRRPDVLNVSSVEALLSLDDIYRRLDLPEPLLLFRPPTKHERAPLQSREVVI